MSEFIESVYSKILRVSNEIRNQAPTGPTFEDWRKARKEDLSQSLRALRQMAQAESRKGGFGYAV
jgi:hypothetical protein